MIRDLTNAIVIAILAIIWSASQAEEVVVLTPEQQADAILSATGVSGGLIVHVGCGDGRMTTALHKHDGFLVHGLSSDPTAVEEARQQIRSRDLYGPVSVERWDGRQLPYIDNSVNLLVVESTAEISDDELERVLAPLGVAYIKQGQTWQKHVKPAREGVDEWTHYLHDASGNPVAHDSVVGPPRHLQWTAGPRHSRSHEYTPSLNAVVSSGGRVFYIADQGPIMSLRQPSQWKLLARDAYNGVLLWEQSIDQWFPHLYGWTQGPRQLNCKLVAMGDRVFVTPGLYAPLVELDAATGETLRTYPDSEGTEEILCHRGVLLLVVREVTDARVSAYENWEKMASRDGSPVYLRETRDPLAKDLRNTENKAKRTILAYDSASGRLLWSKSGAETNALRSLSLRACDDQVYYDTQEGLQCCELKSGGLRWSVASTPLRSVSTEALVCLNKKEITVRSPADGKPRWTRLTELASIRDALLIGDSLWLGGGKPYDTGNSKHTGPLWGPYFAVEYRLEDGEVVQEITAENPKHHHRCYDNKATDRFILGGRRGTEFLDLESGDYLWHSWARGTCRYGVMPCNGMLYVPPHACGCYATVKLMGFNALAPARKSDATAVTSPASGRLERGPAYEAGNAQRVVAEGPAAWPTYRADARRSGRANTVISPRLQRRWQANLGTEITSVTTSSNLVLLACPDQHRVVAVDVRSGQTVWTFATGGRVDSPPTVYNGHVLFGSHDGYVYNLRASDGELAWRFRAAKDRSRIVADGQLESPWPVHGSVLVRDDELTFTAGRSSYLDGGLDLYRLSPVTAEVLGRTSIYSPDTETGRQPDQYGPNRMPGARSDILVADDQHLYLRDLTFSLEGKEVAQTKPHLFALTDFLDDTWTHRSYWIFGTDPSISTGCSGQTRNLLYGRLLVFDDETVYGYGRERVHWSNEFEDGKYRLFARQRNADKPHWTCQVPLRVQAMVLTGDILLAAGAGPVPGKPSLQKETNDVPLLLAISAKDGSELARYQLPATPVLDGMAVADGRVLLSLEDGSLLCLTDELDSVTYLPHSIK